ncbi:hypothetical protein AVEN_270270-1 [Araneus ventricosus]|uniref:HTH psq-type domain-containing protein n=1 Tax=Araneus ventricosus TaxID=182803 RepID=A0A4Y2MJD7_ARAVE|nr:hypothetical protein AVEN_270270-1 [Araneus ventricosus]
MHNGILLPPHPFFLPVLPIQRREICFGGIGRWSLARLKLYLSILFSAIEQTDENRVKMASKRKRLNLKENIEVLEIAEKEKLSVPSLAERFHVCKTQISELLKDKEGI